MKDKTELKPCKCGSKPETFIGAEVILVCPKCRISITGKTRKEAITAWNRNL